MFSFITDFFDSGPSHDVVNGVPIPPSKPSPSNNNLSLTNTLDLISTGVQAVGSVWSGFAQNESSEVRSGLLRYNAATYRQSAADILQIGDFNAQQRMEEARQLIGTQRVALAANGIVLDQDTALDLVSETAGVGAVDALLEIANAERQAIEVMRRANIQDQEAGLEDAIGDAQINRGFGDASLRLVQGVQSINQRNEDFGGSNR